MAKLDFNIQVQHYTDDVSLSSNNGRCVLSVTVATAVGTSQYRVYPESGSPGGWSTLTPDGPWKRDIFFLAPGDYKVDYKDDAGERHLMKFTIFSQAQLACLALNQGFLWVTINVRPVSNPASALQVIGYGSSPGLNGEVAVNNGSFVSWQSANGATWSQLLLEGLGVVDSIDEIHFQIPGKCQITLAEDVHYGEPGTPTEIEASYTKQNCSAPGVNDGSITVTVGGGSGNYTFLWDDGPTTQNRAGLAPGIYSVTITDTVTAAVVVFSNIEITAPPVVSEDVSEEIVVEVRRPSCDVSRSVFLCWLNSLGGWDQWLFEDRNNDFEDEISMRTNEEFSRYVEKLDADPSQVDYLSRTVRRSMRLGTGKIGPDQVLGFAELFSSPKVLMLTSEPHVRPPEWIGVRVKDGSFRFNAYTQEAEISIELPEFNIQTN